MKIVNPHKIAIFRALQLGDMMCLIPAVRALRAAYPDAEITLIGMPWEELFVKKFDMYFNHFISFPGFPGLPEQKFNADSTLSFFQEIRKIHYDVVLQMHGTGLFVNSMLAFLNTSHIAGYYDPHSWMPDPNLCMIYPDKGPEILRHLQLMSFLQVPLKGTHLEFPLTHTDFDKAETLKKRYNITGAYVCIHPGSRSERRRWPPIYFAGLADECAQKGYTICITGTLTENNIIQEVIQHMHHPAINLAGRTELGTVGAIIAKTSLLICNDTGVSHISDALDIPSIVFAITEDYERWKPLNDQLHHTFCTDSSSEERIMKKALGSIDKLLLKI